MFKGPQLLKFSNQGYGFCVLHVVLWSFTFVRNFIILPQTVFNFKRTGVHGRNGYVQCSKAITARVSNAELRFMCSAIHLIVLYMCVKFNEHISDSIRVMDGSADGRTLKILEGTT